MSLAPAPARSVLISPVNLSEGRRLDHITKIAEKASSICRVLDIHADPDHNRSVMTLAGQVGSLVDGILALSAEAVRLIDITRHHGAHPRFGAVDVIPFVCPFPASESAYPPQTAIEAALRCARRIWDELKVPCFLYEFSAPRRERVPLPLPLVRKEAFAGMLPDFGEGRPHPTAGAVAVGARPPLVAYNIDLDATDIRIAAQIAAGLRRRFESVRALGLPLNSRGSVQVSCNLLSPANITMKDVFLAVSELAEHLGTPVLGSEVAGLVPRAAFGGMTPAELRFSRQPKVLEECLENLA